ncbi:MAG: class I SAM-dependent methyltransferase [Planctomycetes bacterium]|nr:class I SAM-dependent methyltransferase [Planctomycetota bacterium]
MYDAADCRSSTVMDCVHQCVPELERIKSVMTPLLSSRRAVGDDGESIDVSKLSICPDAARVLEDMVETVAPMHAVEIGCATGASTLCIASGMLKAGSLGPASIDVADPKQSSHWKNMGRLHLQAAGLEEAVSIHEECAHEMLPRLLSQGVKIGFAFIDGWHMLDYIMVEAFFCDQMLQLGGVIALHDYWMPATQHFASFWCTNRNYEPVICRDGRIVNAPANFTPALKPCHYEHSRFFRDQLAQFVDEKILFLRKTAHDERKWDFYCDYT